MVPPLSLRSSTSIVNPHPRPRFCCSSRVLPIVALSAASCLAAAQTQTVTVSNRTMTAHLDTSSGHAELDLRNNTANRSLHFADLFRLTLASGTELRSSRLRWDSRFAPSASANGSSFAALCADQSDPTSEAHFHWCLLSAPTHSYMREQLTITAGSKDLPIRDVVLLRASDPHAGVIGTVKGSPIADDAQALAQSRDRFGAGVTDTVEVVQAEEAVASAHEQYISSLYSFNYAKIALARALGMAEEGVKEYFKGK